MLRATSMCTAALAYSGKTPIGRPTIVNIQSPLKVRCTRKRLIAEPCLSFSLSSLSLAITDSDRIHREQYKWTMKERKRGKALYFLLIVWRIAKKREAFVHE